jgi:hypothetical protein
MLSISAQISQGLLAPHVLAGLASHVGKAGYHYLSVAQKVRCFSSASSTKPDMMVNYSPNGSIFETLSSLNSHGMRVRYPQIVCVGNQSSGKTSLTEAMCGINGLFEKKTGMATRRPTSISLVKTAEGPDYIKIGHLGEKVQNIDKARKRLNEENNGEVTDKPLDIVIYSPKIQKECQFIDLPGYIRATKLDEDSTLPAKIRKICKPYIDDSTNIKMVVMSATEDAASSEGLAQIIKHQQLDNSMAVFTKVDMICNDKMQSRPLMSLLNDRSYIPKLGAVGVRLRSQSDLDAGMTIEQMLINEQAFIKAYNLGDKKVNLGIPRLMEMISGEQVKRIAHNLPAIKEQIHKALNEKKQGHTTIRKLMESEDIHGISVELERIITDLHYFSPMRKMLEQSIFQQVSDCVRSYVSERYQWGQGEQSVRVVPEKINLSRARLNFSKLINPNQIETSFSNNLLYGECGRDLSVSDLEKSSNGSFAKGLLGAFVHILHPSETSGETENGYNRVQFTRTISNLVRNVSTPEFAHSALTLATDGIKNFMITNAKASDNNGIAELFFIHIFDKVIKRNSVAEIRNTITQMNLRESLHGRI